jgi:hypothetical protein
MSAARFHLHRRARIAYDTLTPAERDRLEAAIAPLVGIPEGRWPTAGAIRLESPEPLYLVRVDASLRALVGPAEDRRPEVLDLVRHETLQRFFNGAG